MSQPVVTCIPTYDAKPRCHLRSISTGMYLVGRGDGTILTSSTCTSDALWRLKNYTIIWYKDSRGLVYEPEWQDVALSGEIPKDCLLMNLIPPNPDAPGIVELQCRALNVRLACSSQGDVNVVPVDNTSKGVPEECQWEMLVNGGGELCVISCRLDHNRLTWAGKETNQLSFNSATPFTRPAAPTYYRQSCLSKATSWCLVECGDGSVEICPYYNYNKYLAVVDDHAILTDSAESHSHRRWSIIRSAIRGVQIKSSARGLYLGKVEGKLVLRDQDNAIGDAFLWSLDPVHECQFYVSTEQMTRRYKTPLSINVGSNGTAVVTHNSKRLPPGFDASILEYSRSGVRIKQARSNKYLGWNGKASLTAENSPVDWAIQPDDASVIRLGLVPWMLPAAVRQNAPESWTGHQKPTEATLDMPPSLRRPFANWRCWPVEAPSEVKVEADSTGNSPVPTRVEIPDGTSRTVLDGQVRRSGRKRTKIDVSRVVPEVPLSDTTCHQD